MRFLASLVAVSAVACGMAALPQPDPPPIRVRTPADFPLKLPLVEGPVMALDSLRVVAANPPEGNIIKRFNKPGPQNVYRWAWLTAKRKNIEHYDGLARQAAVHEREFWKAYAATNHPQKDIYERFGNEFREFLYLRFLLRESWYYTAMMHHFRWEEDKLGGPLPLIRRTELSLCKALGYSTTQFETFLAWVDLFATEVLPGHMSLMVIVPFRLMS